MKKILSVLVVCFLIISSIGVLAGNNNDKTDFKIKTLSTTLEFSKVQINEKNNDNYIEVTLEGINTFKMTPGEPMLPKLVEIFELPFGVKNVNIEVAPGDVIEKQVNKEITPSPSLLPLITLETNTYTKQEKELSVYSSNEPYPNNLYSYSLRSGLNSENKRVTFLTVDIYPVRYIPNEGKLLTIDSSDIRVTYEDPEPKTKEVSEEYDLAIIAPRIFERQLKRLVDHKNKLGIKTILKTTEEIYKEFDGFDKSEKIKYFIEDAINKNDITYVLLVGGLKSQIFAKPKDNCNEGAKGWYLPVRYTNLYDNPKFPLNSEDVLHDPGVISDLYFADIYDGTGGFSSWDPNGDSIFAAWRKPGFEDDENIDMMPDVALGRLACRSISEVRTVVDKIIKYETSYVQDSDWFNKFTVVSGDGFLDQQDFNIKWDATNHTGCYTIYGQSINPEGEAGPVDTINILIDRTQDTKITFNHDDHLNPALQNGYPAPPITEIVSISPGDILGFRDYTYKPNEGEAYNNDFNPWANISYVNNILTIRGKSYDPKPYGNLTNIHVWVRDDLGRIVFSEWKNNTEMYYEGEWTTGEKALYGRGGAMYYMEDFEKDIIWTSNGRLTSQDDYLNELEKGSGFLFFSGHGSPNVWTDHYPGCPGNRGHGSVSGLKVTSLSPIPPFIRSKPVFPIDSISNGDKLPVTVIGGCHNSQFNVSMILGLLDAMPYIFPRAPERYMWCHGTPVPECFSWRLVRSKNGGAIATMGNTGLGYGMPGKVLTIGGGDGWITIEFFRQYGEQGHEILGDAYSQTLTTYINTFDMTDLESGHPKTVQQWVLLGDPSLKIGGYS